jgi:LL-diaminopimelate aminotransferase
MNIDKSERVKEIPPYLFAEINKKIDQAKQSGVDVISLGIGDPDMPTPKQVIDRLKLAANDPKNHQYPDYAGLPEFREAVAGWYKRRHNVALDPKKEILALIGAKEGSLHLSLAFLNPGDYVLVPAPAYTTYKTSTILANGKVHEMPLLEENNFLPKLEDIDFAKENNIIVCSDNPYSEIGFDGYKPLSFLEIPGAKEVGIELNSLSKSYNMTGWRIGMAVGNEYIIEGMSNVKNNVDSGVFNAVQYAAIEALTKLPDSHIDKLNSIYQKRRDLAHKALTSVGIKVSESKATIYMWCKVPEGYDSASFATLLLEKAGVVVTPGSAYGKQGEGYFRISLTVPDERFKEAVSRIKKALDSQ